MIGIRGIRIASVTIPKQNGEKFAPQGEYELVSTNDKVLAKQPFNTYGGVDISVSPATVKAWDAFRASLTADINALIGIETEAA